MPLEVRRIVTGHNEFGEGVVVHRREADCRVTRPRVPAPQAARSGPRIPCQSTIRWKRRLRNGPASSRNTITSAAARGQQFEWSSGRAYGGFLAHCAPYRVQLGNACFGSRAVVGGRCDEGLRRADSGHWTARRATARCAAAGPVEQNAPG
jgi:hypothetical protein